MVSLLRHTALIFVVRAVDRAGVVRSGNGDLREESVIGQVFHPVGPVRGNVLGLGRHVADRERIAASGPERRRGGVAVSPPLGRNGRQRQAADVLRQHKGRNHDFRAGIDPDIGRIARRQMERQHVGTPVGIDRADVSGDVVGKLSGHGVVRARKDEFLHLDRLGKSHGHGYRGHQRTECKRNHLALGHILGAGRHAGILHVALPVVAGLDGRDRRHDDRTGIGPDRPGGIEGVKVVQPFAPDHPGIAQIGLAFGRPGDANLDRRPLRSRLRRDDLHPIAAAPVDRPGAVRQRAVCRTGFSLRRLVAVVDRKAANDGISRRCRFFGAGPCRRSGIVLPASRQQKRQQRQAENRTVFHIF